MSATPRYYKWYPTVSCDLGTMPVEGDWTMNDRIIQTSENGVKKIFYPNSTGTEWGRNVQERDSRGRMRTVWQAGVPVGPITIVNPYTQEEVQAPVWFMYYGSGVCVAKLPAGEQPEPVET